MQSIICFVFFFFSAFTISAQRKDILLNNDWRTIANDSNQNAYNGFEQSSFNTTKWEKVNVPHNWDAYNGYRRLLHGNKHGYAWYTKHFTVNKGISKRYFLFFEGVGSYATVWLNGKIIGYHAGGRTTFTIDITNYIVSYHSNYLAVRADHPSNITDLPWVCGGCSDERGFSEGSQPMGVFRPVHLIVTNEIKIEPFGVHVWNDKNVSEKSASLNIETTVKNYSEQEKQVTIINKLIDQKNKAVAQTTSAKKIVANSSFIFQQTLSNIQNVVLWDLKNPYLYKLQTSIIENGKVIDEVITPYGIRSVQWSRGKTNQLFINGKPVFINGIAEYEHLLGSSHAFTKEQIVSRVKQVQQLGFNAFRDAHQPHNLLYQKYWDSLGILWWPQLSAHIWYDNKQFRSNFKTLLKDWVIERRNSPSIILWGLQNESKLPRDFAKECSDLIRLLDPTASSQRLITTCNGGEGTDWDVPQNWTGTYGGNPFTYDEDVKKQVLIGEYGAWRTLDLHTEGNFKQNGPLSEDRMTQLMETKIRLAEKVRDSSVGQFFWLLTSHDNPGRVQGGEGLRELDRVGPVNYKGLLTPWEEPTDAYYMFKSNYADKLKDPMVYIVSHTWPNRWMNVGKKDSIIVYSNCDEVELFNDVQHISLGKKKKNKIGTHFQWDGVDINYNVLYAIGYIDGKEVAHDVIVLNHLPKAPHFNELKKENKNLLKPQQDYNYIYRVNCGGGNYTDENGNVWLADKSIQKPKVKSQNLSVGSTSWANDFENVPSFFASQRRTFSPISGTKDWRLFQDFRYGREKLKYRFPVPDGEYLVELYFIEPWLGIGSKSDCKKMRLFDVVINNKTVLHDLDIWNEVGTNAVLKKTVTAFIKGGKLEISFPHVQAGQAVISAIAIASKNKNIHPAKSESLIAELKCSSCKEQSWLDIGNYIFKNDSVQINSLPPNLFGADWLQFNKHFSQEEISFSATKQADVFLAVKQYAKQLQFGELLSSALITDEAKGTTYNIYRKRIDANTKLTVEINQDRLLMILPVVNMQPAYDLKPVLSFKPVQAKTNGDVFKETVNTKDALTFKNDNASVEWNFNIGEADIYSFTIRYANETNNVAKGLLQLLAADGTLMKQEEIVFTTSAKGKWNYITTNSGSMINAGNYTIKIIATDAKGISVSGLDIQ